MNDYLCVTVNNKKYEIGDDIFRIMVTSGKKGISALKYILEQYIGDDKDALENVYEGRICLHVSISGCGPDDDEYDFYGIEEIKKVMQDPEHAIYPRGNRMYAELSYASKSWLENILNFNTR